MTERIIEHYKFDTDEIRIELTLTDDGGCRASWTVTVNGNQARTVSKRADIVVNGRHGVVILPFVIKMDEDKNEELDYSPPGMDDAATIRLKEEARRHVEGVLEGSSV